jgi:hypothetical protein
MAGKKGTKKAAKAAHPTLATVAGNANAALMAVSTTAAPDDAKKDTIFRCIVSTFDAQGLNHIQSRQDKIVWSTIDNPVIVALGTGITNCINAKGFVCTPLAPAFQNLKNMGQVTMVGDLTNGIAMVVTP